MEDDFNEMNHVDFGLDDEKDEEHCETQKMDIDHSSETQPESNLSITNKEEEGKKNQDNIKEKDEDEELKYYLDPFKIKTPDDNLLVAGREVEFDAIYKTAISNLENEYFNILDSQKKPNANRCDYKLEPLSDPTVKYVISLRNRNPVMSFGISFDRKQYQENIMTDKVKEAWYLGFQKEFGGFQIYRCKDEQMKKLLTIDKSLEKFKKYVLLYPNPLEDRIYFEVTYDFLANMNNNPSEFEWLENETANLGSEILRNPEILKKNPQNNQQKKRNFKDFVSSSFATSGPAHESSEDEDCEEGGGEEGQQPKKKRKKRKRKNFKNGEQENINQISTQFESLYRLFFRTEESQQDELALGTPAFTQYLYQFEEIIESYIEVSVSKIIASSIINKFIDESGTRQKLLVVLSQIYKNAHRDHPKHRIAHTLRCSWKLFLHNLCDPNNENNVKRTFFSKKSKNSNGDSFYKTMNFLIRSCLVGAGNSTVTKYSDEIDDIFLPNLPSFIRDEEIHWEKVIVESDDIRCVITDRSINRGDFGFRIKIEDTNEGHYAHFAYASSDQARIFCTGLIMVINSITLGIDRCLKNHIVHNFELFQNTSSSSSSISFIEAKITNFFMNYYKENEDDENQINERMEYYTNLFSNNQGMTEEKVIETILESDSFQTINNVLKIITSLIITNIKTLAQYRKITTS